MSASNYAPIPQVDMRRKLGRVLATQFNDE
jgi:hypothetical protein